MSETASSLMSWSWWAAHMFRDFSFPPMFPQHLDFQSSYICRSSSHFPGLITALCHFLPFPKLGLSSPRVCTCLHLFHVSRPNWSLVLSKETRKTHPSHVNLWAPMWPWLGKMGRRPDWKCRQVVGCLEWLDTCSHSSWGQNNYSWASGGNTLLSNVKWCQVVGR